MRTCTVCSSPHRTEYEKMRFEERKTIKEIWKYANEHYGENIGYYSFVRHFNNHVESVIQEMKKASKLREKILQEEIKKDIRIAKQLTRNLEICAQKIESKLQQGDLSPKDEKILLDYLAETRLIIEELLKWSNKINIQPEEENIFERIIYCMQDFPEELIMKFKERWDNYEYRGQ